MYRLKQENKRVHEAIFNAVTMLEVEMKYNFLRRILRKIHSKFCKLFKEYKEKLE